MICKIDLKWKALIDTWIEVLRQDESQSGYRSGIFGQLYDWQEDAHDPMGVLADLYINYGVEMGYYETVSLTAMQWDYVGLRDLIFMHNIDPDNLCYLDELTPYYPPFLLLPETLRRSSSNSLAFVIGLITDAVTNNFNDETGAYTLAHLIRLENLKNPYWAIAELLEKTITYEGKYCTCCQASRNRRQKLGPAQRTLDAVSIHPQNAGGDEHCGHLRATSKGDEAISVSGL